MLDIKFPQRDAFPKESSIGTSINRQIANNIKIQMTKIPNKERFIFWKVLNLRFGICLLIACRSPPYKVLVRRTDLGAGRCFEI